MFCQNCGKQLPDDAKVCDACNASVEEAEVVEAQAQEVENTIEAEAVAEQSVAEASPESAQEAFEEPVFEEAPVKKSKKGLIVGICAAVAVIVAAALLVINSSALQGFYFKTFGSDEDYFKFVEYKAFTEGTEEISNIYGELTDTLDAEISSTADMKLEVSDEAIALLKQVVGDMDISWIKNINLEIEAEAENAKEDLSLALKIGDETILDANAIVDMKEGGVYLALANLSDKYLAIENEATPEVSKLIYDEDFRKALPDEDELEEILNKYIKLAVDNIDNVSKDTEALEIDGIKQELTALEFKLTEKNSMEIAEAVLKELKKDEDVKTYIKDIEKAVKEYLGDEVPEDLDFYDSFKETVNEAIDEIKDGEYDKDKAVILWTDYVNNKHEIVGRSFESDGEAIVNYATVFNGDKFAFEFDCMGLVVAGNGTEKKDVVNADYSVKYTDQEIIAVKVSDFDNATLEDGYINGKVKFTPNMTTIASLSGVDSGEAMALSALNIGLELDMKTAKDKADVDVNVIYGDKDFLGIVISSETKDGAKVELPASDKTVDVEKADEWLSGLDFTKVTDALEKAGLPEDLLQGLIATIPSMIGSNTLEAELY